MRRTWEGKCGCTSEKMMFRGLLYSKQLHQTSVGPPSKGSSKLSVMLLVGTSSNSLNTVAFLVNTLPRAHSKNATPPATFLQRHSENQGGHTWLSWLPERIWGLVAFRSVHQLSALGGAAGWECLVVQWHPKAKTQGIVPLASSSLLE